MFEPFFTTKEIGKGSGLGLAQVYGFVQQSGGTVRVASTVGEGTTVTLILPRSPVPARPAHPRLDEPGTSAARRALAGPILVVEDDDEVAALVTEMFRDLGYRVTRAASAAAALGALADDALIALVFTDVMMPGTMNGMELAREVRRRRPDMPILLTTGYAGTVQKTAETERIDVLCKPYEIRALEAALRSALSSATRLP
jgi:CheY-like chemotaxis protein